jgi:hypothetical protein
VCRKPSRIRVRPRIPSSASPDYFFSKLSRSLDAYGLDSEPRTGTQLGAEFPRPELHDYGASVEPPSYLHSTPQRIHHQLISKELQKGDENPPTEISERFHSPLEHMKDK